MAAASMAVAANAASVVSLQKQSARLSSSAAFGAPLVSAAPLRPAAAKQHLAVARAALPEESSNRIARREVLAGLMAVGAAFTNVANVKAAQGPGDDGADRTAKKADDLLKAADDFKNKDSPPRFGAGEAGSADQAGELTQKAGTGAVEGFQGASDTATEKAPKGLDTMRQNFQKLFDSGNAELPSFDSVTGKVKSDVDVTQGKVKDDVSNTQKATDTVGSGIDAKGKADELVSDAQSKTDTVAQNGKSIVDNITSKFSELIPQ